MSFVAEDKDADAVAAAWVVRLDRGALSAAEQQELDAWLQSSSRNLGAFVRAQAIWSDVDRLAALDSGPAARPARATPPRRYRLAASIAAMAAVAALAALVAAYGFFSGREVTDLGEIRRITLDDGSSVVLNTSSVVQVRFEENERRIVLKRGEASFQVAHDMHRPFIVQARDVAVTAVGTKFTVRLAPSRVDVTVAEGVVEVVRPAENRTERRVLSRNLQLLAAEARPMSQRRLSPAELSRRLAWEEGLLEFDGERLSQAVAEVNRYSPVPVIIDSERLANQSFVGVFRTGDARAFVYSAAAAFGGRVTEEPDGLHLSD